jgi:hypothetical protein
MPRQNHRSCARRAPGRPARRPWLLIAGITGALLVAALAVTAVMMRGSASAAGEAASRGFSAVTDCRGYPQFTPGYGFKGGVIISTSLPERMGLILLDPAQEGKGFQHPSWVKAGNLGPFTADKDGNIYVGPVPRVSLADNPPEGANTIWRVDTTSAEMQPFLKLPAAADPNERNPYGILGLAYDCDTGSIYASSVAGSGPASEVGPVWLFPSVGRRGVDPRSATKSIHPCTLRKAFHAARRDAGISKPACVHSLRHSPP